MCWATTNWGKLFLAFPCLSIFADLPYLGKKNLEKSNFSPQGIPEMLLKFYKQLFFTLSVEVSKGKQESQILDFLLYHVCWHRKKWRILFLLQNQACVTTSSRFYSPPIPLLLLPDPPSLEFNNHTRTMLCYTLKFQILLAPPKNSVKFKVSFKKLNMKDFKLLLPNLYQKHLLFIN